MVRCQAFDENGGQSANHIPMHQDVPAKVPEPLGCEYCEETPVRWFQGMSRRLTAQTILASRQGKTAPAEQPIARASRSVTQTYRAIQNGCYSARLSRPRGIFARAMLFARK